MRKWNIIHQHTKIPRAKFLEILKFCLLDNNYFIYSGNIYNQIFEMPMVDELDACIFQLQSYRDILGPNDNSICSDNLYFNDKQNILSLKYKLSLQILLAFVSRIALLMSETPANPSLPV